MKKRKRRMGGGGRVYIDLRLAGGPCALVSAKRGRSHCGDGRGRVAVLPFVVRGEGGLLLAGGQNGKGRLSLSLTPTLRYRIGGETVGKP